MEKKSKKSIVIGLTSLFLVTLLMLGLTYAYYRTRIIGNESIDPSISVTSKKLEITYNDGNGNLNATNIAPGEDIKFKTKTGEEVLSKTFSVENTGDAAATYGVYLESVLNEFKRVEDIKLKITCESTVSGKTCNGANINYPQIDSLLLSNELEKDEIQNYELTMEYVYYDNIDQSEDMGKSINGKIQIYDLTNILLDDTTLAYKIVNNVQTGKTSTVYRIEPLSIPAQDSSTILSQTTSGQATKALVDDQYYTYAKEVAFDELSGYSLVNPEVDTWGNIKADANKLANFKYLRRETGVVDKPVDENNKPIERTTTIKDMVRVDSTTNNVLTYTMLELQSTGSSVEKTMSATLDDYGVSFYYRGDVDDNYVEYNGMCWRIVRILGDGSIKLILESTSKCSNSMPLNMLITTGPYGSVNDGNGVYLLNYLNDTVNGYNQTEPEKIPARQVLNAWLSTNNFDTTQLKKGDWCLGNNIDAYNYNAPYNYLGSNALSLIKNKESIIFEEYRRLYRIYPEQSTLLCSENALKASDDYIGLITLDEATFAGFRFGFAGGSEYLSKTMSSSLMTLTPLNYSDGMGRIAGVSKTGGTSTWLTYSSVQGIRPTIVLRNTTLYGTGTGSVTDPYTIGS